jgi:hypothetical protein
MSFVYIAVISCTALDNKYFTRGHIDIDCGLRNVNVFKKIGDSIILYIKRKLGLMTQHIE